MEENVAADLEGVEEDDFGIGGTVEALEEIWGARLAGIVGLLIGLVGDGEGGVLVSML